MLTKANENLQQMLDSSHRYDIHHWYIVPDNITLAQSA